MQKAKDSNGDILTRGLIGLKDTYTNKVYHFWELISKEPPS
jgi:hypothetical protein